MDIYEILDNLKTHEAGTNSEFKLVNLIIALTEQVAELQGRVKDLEKTEGVSK